MDRSLMLFQEFLLPHLFSRQRYNNNLISGTCQWLPGLGAMLFAKPRMRLPISFHKTNRSLLWQYDFPQWYYPFAMLYHYTGWQDQKLFQVSTALLLPNLNRRSQPLHKLAHNSVPGQLPAQNIQLLYRYQPE